MKIKENIVRKILKILNISYEGLLKNIKYEQRVSELTERAIKSTERGTTDEKLCKEELIVSLTTYDKRLSDVYLSIESIMQGTIKPNRIILWIDKSIDYIPQTLKNQEKRGLEIKVCEDIRSYKKLIPTLKEFPESTIITIDDDLIYNYDFVENLIREHNKYPDVICANRVHRIITENGKPKSYLNWEMAHNKVGESYNNFLTGGGGVLYPPKSLDEEIFNQAVFEDICKYADDVWFFAMAVKKGTKIRKCPTKSPKSEEYMVNEDLQETGLWKENCNPENCRNDIQIKAVFEKYGINDKLS